jgi:hypothetical protein
VKNAPLAAGALFLPFDALRCPQNFLVSKLYCNDLTYNQ